MKNTNQRACQPSSVPNSAQLVLIAKFLICFKLFSVYMCVCLCVYVYMYLYLLVCITVTKRNSARVAFSLRQRLIDSSLCMPRHPFSALGSVFLGSIIYIFMAWEDLCAPSFRRCASCSRSSAKIFFYFSFFRFELSSFVFSFFVFYSLAAKWFPTLA